MGDTGVSDQVPRQLKVLQLCHDYEGPFQFICHQYNQAFSKSDVTTVYLKGDDNQEVTKLTGGNRVVYFNQRSGTLRGIKFSSIFRLAAMFRQHDFDVVIAHRYKAIYLAGIMSYFFKPFQILAVVHEHDVFKRITRSLFVTFWRPRIYLIAVSESVARNIVKYCPSVAAEGRISTLGHAIGAGIPLFDRESARQRLELGPDKFVFGTVGRLVAKKQFSLLISAFEKAKLDDECVLVVLGSGPEEESLRALVESLGIEEKILFRGHVDHAIAYYRGFDGFVFATGAQEAFGMVLLEAMLAGLPILASDAAGPDEVLGEVGLRFHLGDVDDLAAKLRVLYGLSEEERRHQGLLSRSRFETNFTMEHFTKRLMALPPLAGHQ